jgi:hypothetical protein
VLLTGGISTPFAPMNFVGVFSRGHCERKEYPLIFEDLQKTEQLSYIASFVDMFNLNSFINEKVTF